MLIRNDSGREALADIKVSGVNLTEGELTGLNHLERSGNADLETKTFSKFIMPDFKYLRFRNDRVFISFTVSVKDLH